MKALMTRQMAQTRTTTMADKRHGRIAVLKRYWTKGEGAAKIGWGTPGDFNRCRLQLRKYVTSGRVLDGLCANMHHQATGTWPGSRGGKGK